MVKRSGSNPGHPNLQSRTNLTREALFPPGLRERPGLPRHPVPAPGQIGGPRRKVPPGEEGEESLRSASSCPEPAIGGG